MIDLLALSKSKTAAKKAANALEISELKKLIDNLQAALDAAKIRESAKEEKKKAAAMKKLKSMMSEMGLSAADLAKLSGNAPKKRGRKPTKKKAASKVPAKYEIQANGETIRWTGRGRMPVVFRELVESGGSLEQCLIK